MPLPCRHFRPASITLHFERVDHHRHARDVRLGGDQVQELHHRRFRVEHALVHVDVEHLRAALDLLPRDRDGLVVAVLQDQLLELRRAGDVGAFADVDEVAFGRDRQRFEAAEAGLAGKLFMRRPPAAGSRRGGRPRTASAIARDVRRRGAAAAADQVQQARPRRIRAASPAMSSGRLVVAAEGIRQAGVGMRADVGIGDLGEDVDVRAQVLGAERAVQADRQRLRMPQRVPEGFGGLARQRAAGASVIVPEIITGRRPPRAANTSSIANSAALALSVSKIVSTMSTSAPPSIRPSAASR